MTGTSIDGLDLAAISVTADDQIQLLACASHDLPQQLTAGLRGLARSEDVNFNDYGESDAQLGEYIGQCASDWIDELQQRGIVSRTDIKAIGSHGQTVHHAPAGNYPFTLQIGDPSRIARAAQLPVVADFRRADIAAGGQGAPLVPPFHQRIFADPIEHRVVCNIGGISNITDLPVGTQPNEPLAHGLIGFDTGPGNTLLDAWYEKHNDDDSNIDLDGAWARAGKVDPALLERLLADPFFALSSPKSTGPEYFNLDWLFRHLTNETPSTVQATLVELTAHSICDALPSTTETLILCGGGRHNGYLVERLTARANARVSACDAMGIDGDGLEAAAFAWLASRTLNGLPGNEPSVTGARARVLLGNVTPDPSHTPNTA